MKLGEFEYISQTEYWDFFFKQEDSVKLLQYNIPQNIRKEIFNKYVSVINIETSSYCNRNCGYCPVSDLATKTKEYICDEHFLQILDDLDNLKFSGIITLNLFNEPLASSDDLIKRLRSIKKVCPDSYIRINSNGDYLTKELLLKLKDAGISELLITLHTTKQVSYDDTIQLKRLDKFIDKLGLTEIKKLKNFDSNKNITYEIVWNKIRLLIVSNNWDMYGNDRGGTVEKLSTNSRNTPCVVPFREVVVDYNGAVIICWNVFRDKTNYIGQIGKKSLINVYFDNPAVNLRREMLTYDKKKGIHATCNVESFSDKSTTEVREKLLLKAIKTSPKED